MQEFFKRAQQLRLVHMIGIDVEMIGRDAHDILAVELRGDDIRSGQTRLVYGGHQMTDQRSLAGADIAGDDDEAFTLRQAIAKI